MAALAQLCEWVHERRAALRRCMREALQWRPRQWPVWNHAITRGLRIWQAGVGRDHIAFGALAGGDLARVVLEERRTSSPSWPRSASNATLGGGHLARGTESFYERELRRVHRGDAVSPQDHLSSAVAGFLDLDDAIHRLEA